LPLDPEVIDQYIEYADRLRPHVLIPPSRFTTPFNDDAIFCLKERKERFRPITGLIPRDFLQSCSWRSLRRYWVGPTMIDRVIGVASVHDAGEGPFPPNWMRKWDKPCAIAARNLALRLGASDAVAGSTPPSVATPSASMVWTVWPKLDVLDEFEKLKSVLQNQRSTLQKNFLATPASFRCRPIYKPPGGNNQRLTAAPLRTCQNKRWTISVLAELMAVPIAIVSLAPATNVWKTRSTVPNALCYTPTEYRCQRSELSAISSSFLKP